MRKRKRKKKKKKIKKWGGHPMAGKKKLFDGFWPFCHGAV
jgi:hypothetical protein